MKLQTAFLALLVATAAACGKSDGTGPSQNGGETALLDVTNNTNVSIYFVFVRNCGATSWGNDLLGADVIPAGLGQSFTIPAGCHDVKLESNPSVNGEMIWTNVSFPAGSVIHQTVSAWSPAQ